MKFGASFTCAPPPELLPLLPQPFRQPGQRGQEGANSRPQLIVDRDSRLMESEPPAIYQMYRENVFLCLKQPFAARISVLDESQRHMLPYETFED